MIFPTERPDASPVFLWTLQLNLLEEAERRLGSKDTTKEIGQPTFSDTGPHIRFSPDQRRVFAELSRAAAGYWPTAVYELAHETIHLLDPIVGGTNWLEEGLAETFALEIGAAWGGHVQMSMPSYRQACGLVAKLPYPPFEAGRRVRADCGALSRAAPEGLLRLFPGMTPALAEGLTAAFKRA